MNAGAPDGAAPRAALGIDVGGTKVLGVALDASGTVLAEARLPTPRSATDGAGYDGAEAVADAVADVALRLAEAVGVQVAGAGSVGVGVPGMLDRSGVLRFSPNLPGAVGADISALVARRLGPGQLRLGNDANCAAVAELRLGAARGAEHAVVVTLGTGIGGGLIADGRVQLGARGFAGEIGHMVVDPSGPRCPCGGRGCWERFASGGGLGRLAREAAFGGSLREAVALAGGDPELVRGEHVTRAALAGDPGALAVVEELGWWVALGLSNLVAVCDPERIVVGGGVAEVGDLLLEPTRQAFAGLVEAWSARPAIPIVGAQLGERAGAVGAALLAHESGLR